MTLIRSAAALRHVRARRMNGTCSIPSDDPMQSRRTMNDVLWLISLTMGTVSMLLLSFGLDVP